MRISSSKLSAVKKFGNIMFRDDVTPDIERIAGLYPRGYISIVASSAGVGKTWLMQYIACQLSTGGTILNGIVRKSPSYKTVIFSGETGTFLLDKRLGKTNWPFKANKIKVYSAIDMMLEDIPCMINTLEGQETVIAVVAQEKPDIIFFDTLISWHSIDESKQAEMTSIYTFLLRLAKSFECAVVVNHHMRKRPANDTGRKYTQDDVIGSSAGVRIASSVYLITPEDLGEGVSKMYVHNVKSWDKKVPGFSYQFITNDEGYLDFKIDFDTGGNNALWSLRERMHEFLKYYEVDALLMPATVAKELSVHVDTVRLYLDEFVKKGNLERTTIMGKLAFRVVQVVE